MLLPVFGQKHASIAMLLLPVVLVLAQNDHKGSAVNKAFNDHKGAAQNEAAWAAAAAARAPQAAAA